MTLVGMYILQFADPTRNLASKFCRHAIKSHYISLYHIPINHSWITIDSPLSYYYPTTIPWISHWYQIEYLIDIIGYLIDIIGYSMNIPWKSYLWRISHRSHLAHPLSQNKTTETGAFSSAFSAKVRRRNPPEIAGSSVETRWIQYFLGGSWNR